VCAAAFGHEREEGTHTEALSTPAVHSGESRGTWYLRAGGESMSAQDLCESITLTGAMKLGRPSTRLRRGGEGEAVPASLVQPAVRARFAQRAERGEGERGRTCRSQSPSPLARRLVLRAGLLWPSAGGRSSGSRLELRGLHRTQGCRRASLAGCLLLGCVPAWAVPGSGERSTRRGAGSGARRRGWTAVVAVASRCVRL